MLSLFDAHPLKPFSIVFVAALASRPLWMDVPSAEAPAFRRNDGGCAFPMISNWRSTAERSSWFSSYCPKVISAALSMRWGLVGDVGIGCWRTGVSRPPVLPDHPHPNPLPSRDVCETASGRRFRRRSGASALGSARSRGGQCGFRRFQACVPAVGCAKRRARPMRAYARAGPSVSLTARTML